MIAILDTNVLYQALRNSGGASNYILRLIREEKIDLAVSLKVFKEYEAVLLRKTSLADFGLTKDDVEAILDFVAFIAKPFEIHFLFRPNLPDEDDNIFVELALASTSNFLITNNVKDYQKSELRFDQLNIVTPSEFVKFWRHNYEK